MGLMAINVRLETLITLAKGLATAILITLGGMLLLSAVVVFLPVSDALSLALNQMLKITSIFFGALTAIGFGGRRGFAMGAAIGHLYMALGYTVYCILDQALAPAVQMTGELLMGTLIGALSGAVVANISPKRKKGRGRKRI